MSRVGPTAKFGGLATSWRDLCPAPSPAWNGRCDCSCLWSQVARLQHEKVIVRRCDDLYMSHAEEIRNLQDPVQLSKQAIWLRSHSHLDSQIMFIRTCFHNHQYYQPLSHFFGQFHPTVKESVISPQLNKPTQWIKANCPTTGQSV